MLTLLDFSEFLGLMAQGGRGSAVILMLKSTGGTQLTPAMKATLGQVISLA